MSDRSVMAIAGALAGRHETPMDNLVFHENAASYIAELLSRLTEAQAEVARLRADAASMPSPFYVEVDEPPDACYCAATSMPPCSWCTDPARPGADL